MKIKKVNPTGLLFWCPGCNCGHYIRQGEGGWTWNEDTNCPTITPSVLVTWEANPDATEEFKEWRTTRVCHSFVTNGKIQFLGDSTHELSGQTVDLPDWQPYTEKPLD